MRLFIVCLSLFSSIAFADNAKCIGAPDRYEGSKKGCSDSRIPKESKFKKEEKIEAPVAQPAREQMPKVIKL